MTHPCISLSLIWVRLSLAEIDVFHFVQATFSPTLKSLFIALTLFVCPQALLGVPLWDLNRKTFKYKNLHNFFTNINIESLVLHTIVL